MSRSPALDLPYLMPTQAQKHVTVNEALSRLDALVQMRLQGLDQITPPALPSEGAHYAVGTGATGAFAGQDGNIARWADGAWTFSPPVEGQMVLDLSSGRLLVWIAGNWQPPALEQQTQLGVGTAPDATNRLSVASPASLFSHAGSDHRMVLNKASMTDTASVMFQSGWSGRAELGLTGDDGFSLKLSPDGGAWSQVLHADPATGYIGIGLTNPSTALDVAGAMRCGQTTSASRPPAATSGVGAMIYDTDLNLAIWSDGSNWRNASGTVV